MHRFTSGKRISINEIYVIALSVLVISLSGCDSKPEVGRQTSPVQVPAQDEISIRLARDYEQVKVECRNKHAVHDAEYRKLLDGKHYWEAADAIRVCAEALEDDKDRALVAAAETRYYIVEINNPKKSVQDKANAIQRYIRDYPEQGQKYAGTLAQLTKRIETNEKLADAKKKKSTGVRIGMTPEEAIASSWGRPQSVNRTTYANSSHEQWVYGGNNYLYFESGRLTAIQN